MANQIPLERFTENLYALLDETFEQVHGIYLDRGTSLFETLETVSAEDAARPISARCASIAAQVHHVTFYLQVLQDYMLGKQVGRVDWPASWQVPPVTPAEWDALKQRLRAAHQSVLATIKGIESWDGEDELGGALAIVVHTAYHLGEIRQALGVLHPDG
jgi:hypothetical protein